MSGCIRPRGCSRCLLFAPCLMLERARVHHARLHDRSSRSPYPTPTLSCPPRTDEVSTDQTVDCQRIDLKRSLMPEVIFTGPAGRLEGRYHPAKQKNAPIAMILHPHPQFHGTMNHQIVYQCYY